jgi:hypothetical protein
MSNDSPGDNRQSAMEGSRTVSPEFQALSPPGGHNSASGVTQTIRCKLNFSDEIKWRKFSARRLELIDDLELSSKKASEQDDKIYYVANSLRQEYGFPVETLADFDKLVRAGIQSVRRNRKRSKIKHNHVLIQPITTNPSSSNSSNSQFISANMDCTSDSNADTSVQSAIKRSRPNHETDPDRMSINSIISPSRPSALPSLSNLSFHDHFRLAIERLNAFTAKVSSSMPTNSNTEFLGSSVINVSAASAVERKFPNSEMADIVRGLVLSYVMMSALVKSLGLSSFSSMKVRLASCCREFGFDAIVHSLSNVYYEMLDLDSNLDLTQPSSYDKLALAFPPPSMPPTVQSYPSAPSSAIAALSLGGPRIRPVTLRYMDQKLEFTYDAQASTPPTVAEVIDNGRNAFSINSSQMLQIRNLNKQGRTLSTDADIADAFTEPRIDIELFPVRQDRHYQPIAMKPKFQELL